MQQCRILRGHSGFHRLNDIMLLIAGYQQVIWREANLSGVHHFTKGDALACLFLVCAATNDSRRLAAKFERYRHQIIRGCAHDMPSNARRARKDHMVKGQFGKRHAHFSIAGKNRHFFFSKIFRHDLFKQGRYALSKFRRLNHGPVTSGKNTSHRHHHHTNREVPRRNNADNALWLIYNLSF